MPLPILKGAFSASNTDLVRFFHKIELEHTRHLGKESPLDCGTAIVNRELASVADANSVLDASLAPQADAESAAAEVEAHFTALGAACRRWVMNPSAPLERTAPLVAYLQGCGCVTKVSDILHLPRLPQKPVVEVGGLRIIPARASFKHLRALAEEAGGEGDAPDAAAADLAEAATLHADDPHYEAILALKDGRAVALAAVLGVGELAGVRELFVSESFRRQGIGRTMMSRALEVCVRSLSRHILLSVAAENVAAQGLYRQLGFEKAGEFVELVVEPNAVL